MILLKFHGFSQEEVDRMMPRIVEILGLGHPMYSVEMHPEIPLYDDKGIPLGHGKMIEIPPFGKVRQDLNLLNKIAKEFGYPVSTVLAEPKLAVGDDLF